jgi:hypothetical protein
MALIQQQLDYEDYLIECSRQVKEALPGANLQEFSRESLLYLRTYNLLHVPNTTNEEHPKTVYLAQSITNNRRQKPLWHGQLARGFAQEGILMLDPTGNLSTDPLPLKNGRMLGAEYIVMLDILMALHSTVVLLDLNSGPSIGATLECVLARQAFRKLVPNATPPYTVGLHYGGRVSFWSEVVVVQPQLYNNIRELPKTGLR